MMDLLFLRENTGIFLSCFIGLQMDNLPRKRAEDLA
jgi:hypothetical protein